VSHLKFLNFSSWHGGQLCKTYNLLHAVVSEVQTWYYSKLQAETIAAAIRTGDDETHDKNHGNVHQDEHYLISLH